MNRRLISKGAVVALIGVAAACSEAGGPAECLPSDPTCNPQQVAGDISQFVNGLPSWSQFSPLGTEQDPTPTAAATELPDTLVDVRAIEGDTVALLPKLRYACTEQPFTMSKNPRQIVMYSPDKDILWPGALIQGSSYRNKLGALLSLPIKERAAVKVSIPGLANNDNFREVVDPDQATVAQAIGSMIGNATQQGLSTPSTISFEWTSYHSESQFALSVGISGRYMGFEASATGDVRRNAAETTVTAHFYQKMYEVVVETPSTPGAFFGSEFTQAKLQEQQNLGRIGPDNIPVYVANVVYGRMMMFSFTSTASDDEIRGTLNAAYNGIGGGGSASLSARQQTILKESKISITSLGGNAEATIAMIRSGDWRDYFTDAAPLSSAEPLSYAFKHLDGTPATVTESTDFVIKECSAKPATPGTFEFLPPTQEPMAIPTTGVRVLSGDFNGDGRDDLVWNSVSASSNQTWVAFGEETAELSFAATAAHPETAPTGWTGFQTLVGDVNGDGLDDLIWNEAAAENRTYLGVSNGDGTFAYPSVRIHPNTNWGAGYIVHVADINGDNRADLVWNYRFSTRVRNYVALSNGDNTFQFPPFSERTGNYSGYQHALVADVDGDGNDDVLVNSLGSGFNNTYVGFSDGDSTLAFSYVGVSSSGGWNGYTPYTGDVNNDGNADMIWVEDDGVPRIYTGISNGSSALALSSPQDDATNGEEGPFGVLVGDVNGDGHSDVVWNRLQSLANRSFVSLGVSDGTFDVSPDDQLHPDQSTNWELYTVLLADINGDGRDDLIWNHPAATNTIFVGVAKANQ